MSFTLNKRLVTPEYLDDIADFLLQIPEDARDHIIKIFSKIVENDGVYQDKSTTRKSSLFVMEIALVVHQLDSGKMMYNYDINVFPQYSMDRYFTSSLDVSDEGILLTDNTRQSLTKELIEAPLGFFKFRLSRAILTKRYYRTTLKIEGIDEILTSLESQEVRSYLHVLNSLHGPENIMQMLPTELVDYIADQVYDGRRVYTPIY